MALNLDELRQEHQRLGNTGENGSFLTNFVKMPEGEGAVTVRLLPPDEQKRGKLYCVTRTHRLNNKNLHCLQVLVGNKWQGSCPVCDHYRRLWKESDDTHLTKDQAEAIRTEARKIKPMERYYYNAIVRGPEAEMGPKILSVGKQLHARIIRAMVGDPSVDEPELGDVTDPQNGRDLKIIKKLVKTGQQVYPNYDSSKFLGESKLGTSEQVNAWMSKLHDLAALRQVKSVEEMRQEVAILCGQAQDPATEFSHGANAVPASPPKAAVVPPDADEDEGLPDADFIARIRSL